MTDTPILCPYCGEEMTLKHDDAQDVQVAYYWCRGCGAARIARVRYTPPQEPIPLNDITGTTHRIPCWIETREDDAIWPDVLDEDLEGCCGVLSSLHWYERQHFKPADYNKTWRCWATRPSDEERRNAPWCSTTSAPPTP